MKKPKWEDEFDKTWKSDNDDISFFSYGGDSWDFDIDNCKKFIRKVEEEAFVRGWSECESARADIELDERRKLCDYLLEHGHGGGNFRRLIMEQRDKN